MMKKRKEKREHRRDEVMPKFSVAATEAPPPPPATAYRYNAIQRLNEAPFIIQFIANWTRTPVESIHRVFPAIYPTSASASP